MSVSTEGAERHTGVMIATSVLVLFVGAAVPLVALHPIFTYSTFEARAVPMTATAVVWLVGLCLVLWQLRQRLGSSRTPGTLDHVLGLGPLLSGVAAVASVRFAAFPVAIQWRREGYGWPPLSVGLDNVVQQTYVVGLTLIYVTVAAGLLLEAVAVLPAWLDRLRHRRAVATGEPRVGTAAPGQAEPVEDRGHAQEAPTRPPLTGDPYWYEYPVGLGGEVARAFVRTLIPFALGLAGCFVLMLAIGILAEEGLFGDPGL